MSVEIEFEPSGRNGVVPVGSYLMDVALRLGIKIEDTCGRLGRCDECAVKITKGAGLLSEQTKGELEHLTAQRRKIGERLSCQAKIEQPGELCVMTTVKRKPSESSFEAFEKDFAKLPLDEKIQQLLRLESVTLNDTFNYILSLPSMIGEKIRDGVAEFGYQKEEAERKAKGPAEHKVEVNEEVKSDKVQEVTSEELPIEPKANRKTNRTPKTKAETRPKTAPKKPTTRKAPTKTEAKSED